MKPIRVIPLAGGAIHGAYTEPSLKLLETLAASLARGFHTACQIAAEPLDISRVFDMKRQQYYSTAILQHLQQAAHSGERVLGVAAGDLYVPILTFVFGEAQLDGNCAAVSFARLREEFYGLPAQTSLLQERLFKESVHELGHTFGLRHCTDWSCVMASSYGVEVLDVKGAEFCAECRKVVFQGRG